MFIENYGLKTNVKKIKNRIVYFFINIWANLPIYNECYVYSYVMDFF